MFEKIILIEFMIALFMGLGALSIFIWAVLDKQMEDTEDIKFRIFERETEDERK